MIDTATWMIRAPFEKRTRRACETKPVVDTEWLHYGNAEHNVTNDDDIDAHAAHHAVEKRRLVETVAITADHRQIISQTWPIMSRHMHVSGTKIFLRIFEISHGIKGVFIYLYYLKCLHEHCICSEQ